MPSVPLHLPTTNHSNITNPLPQLLQTPSGLALLEIQGTINAPSRSVKDHENSISSDEESLEHYPIGRLVFPLYSGLNPPDDTAWMRKVYLYVGKHQRLTGEVKKLPNAIAVIRRRPDAAPKGEEAKVEMSEELEIVEIIRHKILFSQRPEPVSG